MSERAPDSSDHLYADKLAAVQDFAFDATVTRVFNDMVRRSVPGYETIVELIGVIAAAHRESVNRPLNCVDLGCSRGTVTKSLLKHLSEPTTRIVAIDNSEAMIQAARNEINDPRATFLIQDILESEFKKVDVMVMNLVLQFVDPDRRLNMLKRIHRGMRDDGLFILTEKIEATEEFVDYHHAFKRTKGYSELEITQKRDALERVMIIDSLKKHKERLREAGFSRVRVWFRLLNWISLLVRP